MGVRGYGNFDNDKAHNYLYSINEQLVNAIKNYFVAYIDDEIYESNELDLDDADEILVPSIDILITLCQHYQTPPAAELEDIQRWKEKFLQTYDLYIDQYGVSAEYKVERRKVIEKTFNELEDIAKSYI